MKRFVNGREVDLSEAAEVEVQQMPDRLMVRTSEGSHSAVVVRSGDTAQVSYRGRIYTVEKASRVRAGKGAGSGEITAPMPGQVVDVLVEEGQSVSKGDKLVVLEAMKTQQAFTAPFNGRVSKAPAQKGEQVAEGQLLVLVEAVDGQ